MSNKELNLVIDRAEDEYQKLKDKVIEQGLEIERLNKGYCKFKEECGKYATCLRENQLKEIERLKEENNFLKLNNPQMNLEHFRVVKENKRKIDNLRQVNKRLNNIINELEKYLIEEIEDYDKHINSQYITDITREQYEGEKVCFEDTLGKLQELKGSNSNE